MSTYRRYQKARNTAWRALLRLDEKCLPVDASALAERLGVCVHPWPDPAENVRLSALASQVSGACVSLRIEGTWHFFLRREGLNPNQARFAVAHELGHLLLHHAVIPLAPGVYRFASEENAADVIDAPRDLMDQDADIFAVRLLAPAFLLHETGVDTAEGIAALCGLPPHAAEMRADRMVILNERNVFYKDALERQARRAFDPWLSARANKNASFPARAVPLILPLREKAAEAKEQGRRALNRPRILRWVFFAAITAALIAFFLLGREG